MYTVYDNIMIVEVEKILNLNRGECFNKLKQQRVQRDRQVIYIIYSAS